LLLSHFIEIFPWEHIKLGELPRHNALGFFCLGRSLEIHTQIKREFFTSPRNQPFTHLEVLGINIWNEKGLHIG
jgi:hypothetical protein